ncbi:unnamed protein product [Caenorhabditis brenneri]
MVADKDAVIQDLSQRLATAEDRNRQHGDSVEDGVANKRRRVEEVHQVINNIKVEPEEEEEVDVNSQAVQQEASVQLMRRQIKKEMREQNPQVAPQEIEGIIVDRVIPPENRKFRNFDEAVVFWRERFPPNYFEMKLQAKGIFNLGFKFPELRYFFRPSDSHNPLPQLVKQPFVYPKLDYKALAALDKQIPPWDKEKKSDVLWKAIMGVVSEVQMEQNRAGLVHWLEKKEKDGVVIIERINKKLDLTSLDIHDLIGVTPIPTQHFLERIADFDRIVRRKEIYTFWYRKVYHSGKHHQKAVQLKMNNGNAPFFHGGQGLIHPQGYRPDHMEQVAIPGPAPIPHANRENGHFPPILHRQTHQNLLLGWDGQGHARHQGGLNVRDPHFPNHLGSWQQPRLADWDNGRFQGRHQHDRAGLNLGNPALVSPQSFQGQDLTAPDFDIEEEVPYENPIILNAQQQQSTSGGPRVGVEPVADISTHSKEDQELLRSIYRDRLRFSTAGPGVAPRAVSPGAIPPPGVTPGPRQGPPSNGVAPIAPVAPRAMAPPGFFPPAPNTPQFMTPPPFNMPGNFWNPGMHPLDREAQMLARIKKLEADYQRVEAENRELRRQLEEAKSGGSSAKRKRPEQLATSRVPVEERLAKIKEEPADDEEVDFAENNKSSASRTIKKEPLDPRGIQPIPRAAPDADLVVLAEIRPEIRRYKSVAEAIKVAEEEFSTEYFSNKFEKFNLPIDISFSEFFSEFLFSPTLLASRPQMPQIVKRNLAYPKLMYDYIFRGETEETRKAKWTEEEKKRWAPAFKELAKVQLEQRRAGLIIWKEQRSTARKQREE